MEWITLTLVAVIVLFVWVTASLVWVVGRVNGNTGDSFVDAVLCIPAALILWIMELFGRKLYG